MGVEELALGSSAIHRLDPRVKIVIALTFSFVVALNQSIPASMAAMAFPLLLICMARMRLRLILGRLAVVNGFILFLWLLLPFTFPGEVIWSLGPLHVHWEGVLQACLITLKSNAILLAMIALLGTSPVFHLVHAMSRLGFPDKLVHLFFFCFRYLHVIHNEYLSLLEAAKIRGFRPTFNLHTYRTYAYFIGALLLRSFDRSERIHAAMKCRGFHGRFYILHTYEMQRADYLIATSSIFFSVVLLALR